MSAERYEITEDAWGDPLINGSRAIMWSDTALIGAIRQQSRDLDQLRADLAAAVAENAALLAANRDCIWHFDAIKADYDVMKLRAEQAEARLAAIDAQPTVVTVGHGDYLHRHTANVPIGTELIARPAKDQT